MEEIYWAGSEQKEKESEDKSSELGSGEDEDVWTLLW